MADFHKKTSMYKDTPVNNFYLDTWEPIQIPTSVLDEEYIIENEFEGKPYMLANERYGTPRLWWVFMVANPDVLQDPIRDFQAGTSIVIPARQTIERII